MKWSLFAMSKRRHGGVWRRKSSKIVAEEGWSNRESNIVDFMKFPLEQTQSQYDLNIEWASSDEEEKFNKPAKELIVKKIRKDYDFCNFNEKLKDFGIYKRKKNNEKNPEHKSLISHLNNDDKKDNCSYISNSIHKISKIENDKKKTLNTNSNKGVEKSSDKVDCLIKQENSHLSKENTNTLSTLSTVKNRVDESDDEKELNISPVIVTNDLSSEQLKKCKQGIKDTIRNTSPCNTVKSTVTSDAKSPTIKTQKRFVQSFTPLSPQNKSPVFSSRRKFEQNIFIATEHCSPVLKSKIKSASSSLEAGTQNIVEQESPVLKSKNLKRPGSPVLNSRKVIKRKLTFGCYSAPNKPLKRDVSFQPHSEDSTRNVLWESKKDSDINVSTPLSRKEDSINTIKKKRRSLALAFAEQVDSNYGKIFESKEIQSEFENEEKRMELENADSISNGSSSAQQTYDILENSKKCNADIEEHDNNEDSSLKMSKYISVLSSSLNCSEESHIGLEDVNETNQVQADSQISDPIEECLTPSKETSSYYGQHHSNKLAPLAHENEGQKGSEWLRALQNKTPERPSKENEKMADPDSSKKKILKDGLAARLRRLLISWQSSAQIWTYQISASEENKPQTSSSYSMKHQTSVVSQQSESSDSLYSPDTSARRKGKEKTRMTVKSPALQNLRCALLAGPTGMNKRHENIIEPTKKTLILKVIQVDCRLPAGGVLCEKLSILDTNSSLQVMKNKESVHENETSDKNLQISEKNHRKHSERYIVIFAVQEQSNIPSFEVNDQVMIYSPWQHLDLPGQKIPTIFSSYFKIQSRPWQSHKEGVRTDKGERNKSPCNKKMKKKIVLTTWSCLCSTNSNVLPTICDGRNFHLKFESNVFNLSINDHILENVCGNFKVIQGSSDKLPLHNSERPQSWSIVEAIEKCGGLSDIPVTVILHLYRIIHIKDLSGNNNHWILIGADIMGIFCTITIPDRPLAKQELKLLLEEGEGTIRSFTHLTVTQRHTDSKSPGLFSLLNSLHHAYQKAIKDNEKMMELTYYNNSSKATQSFCYNFTVTLGSTKSQMVTGVSNIAISLPLWSVQDALQVCGMAQRGSIFFHIIYKVNSYLYVICPDKYSGNSDQTFVSNLSVKNKPESSEPYKSMCSEENCLTRNCESWVTRVSVQEDSVLPSWLEKNGTIMQGAIVRDIISYKGTLMVDGYSVIRMKKSEVNLTLGNLYQILPKLQANSDSHQLVHVSGKICNVDEENAFSWPICEHCSSENLKETTMECSRCGKISVSPETGYSVDVFLDCIEIPSTNVKVKLYQRTIKKLISSCLVSEGEGYDANLMIGKALGPLVCFIEEVKSRSLISARTFILLQLPY